MKGDLKVLVEPRPDRAVQVTLDGSLDAHTFDRFRKTITDLSALGALWIVLDLAKMIYIASVGLNFLVNARVMQRKAGGEMILVAPQSQVMTILKMLGLTEVLVLAPPTAEAWEKIRDGIQPLP